MTRRQPVFAAFALLLVAISVPHPAAALGEAERLWMVGERSFADGLYPVARRTLERFVAEYPADARLPAALLILGKARLALGDVEPALEAFRRAAPPDAAGPTALEAKFWEAETLFRLKRYAEARTAYDAVLRRDAASPHAPEALYGLAWSELELKRPEPAVAAFRDFLATWPQHALAPSATFYLARTLVELTRYADAEPLLGDFTAKHPGHALAPDAQYLLGLARVRAGDHRAGVADLRAFVAAHPSHPLAPAAQRVITETLTRYGDRQELLETYKTLLEQTPPSAEALYDAGSIAGRLDRRRDQEAAWKRLAKEFPEHALTHRAALELANAAYKRHEWKEAAAQAHAATASAETGVRAEALLLAGEADLKLRRLAAAAKSFEAVGAVANVEAGVRYRALAGLGLTREQQQNWKAALAAYETVASKSPDATLREWAKDRAKAVRGRINATRAR
ncbi:MAG: tetratricopeptide repeat protein [Candidatus Rokubacteria bacterium]|nr:tetratricopeptide repeat protein [Candidatus Rokubacteria bacterium]